MKNKTRFDKIKKWGKRTFLSSLILASTPFAITECTYVANQVIPTEKNTAVFTTGYSGGNGRGRDRAAG